MNRKVLADIGKDVELLIKTTANVWLSLKAGRLGVGNDLFSDPIIKANTLISQSGQSEIIGTPSRAHAKLETT